MKNGIEINGKKVAEGECLDLEVINYQGKPRFNTEFAEDDGSCFGIKYMGVSTIHILRIVDDPGIKIGEIWHVQILAITLDDKDMTRDYRLYVFIYVAPLSRVCQVVKSYQGHNGTGWWIERTYSGKILVNEVSLPATSKLKTYIDNKTIVDVEEIISSEDKSEVLARRRVREYSQKEYSLLLARSVGKERLSAMIQKATIRLPQLPIKAGTLTWTFE